MPIENYMIFMVHIIIHLEAHVYEIVRTSGSEEGVNKYRRSNRLQENIDFVRISLRA